MRILVAITRAQSEAGSSESGTRLALGSGDVGRLGGAGDSESRSTLAWSGRPGSRAGQRLELLKAVSSA